MARGVVEDLCSRGVTADDLCLAHLRAARNPGEQMTSSGRRGEAVQKQQRGSGEGQKNFSYDIGDAGLDSGCGLTEATGFCFMRV